MILSQASLHGAVIHFKPMNFLAHSLFGFNDHALIAGQFCGDFVRGRDLSAYPAGIENGIRLHRYLDNYTDTHPTLMQCRTAVLPVRRRFAGILIDVLFDHYLAKNWSSVSALSLDAHAEDVYVALTAHESHLPDSLKRFVIILKRESLLQNNLHLDSIERTLARIAKRSDALAPLALSAAELKPISENLAQPFADFYPDLYRAALNFVAQQPRSAT